MDGKEEAGLGSGKRASARPMWSSGAGTASDLAQL